MIFCSRNQAIIQTTKHGLFTVVSCRNVSTPAESPVSGTALVVALSGSPLIRIRGWGAFLRQSDMCARAGLTGTNLSCGVTDMT